VRQTGRWSQVVDFLGDDGRRESFDVGALPMPGWRPLLAEAFALRTGYDGGARTLNSAKSSFATVGRFARWLEGLEHPPATPAECTRELFEAFIARSQHMESTRMRDGRELRLLLEHEQVSRQIPPGARDALRRRFKIPVGGVGGFSDGEWDRLVAAARADSAAIARRVRAGLDLVKRYRADPVALAPDERTRAAVLAGAAMAEKMPTSVGTPFRNRAQMAGQLNLRWQDIAPLTVLMVALCERNGETVKELPAAHRILAGRAVELTVIKRRHGQASWTESVTWEIGEPGRELHTPGGFYLLLHELTAHARSICGSAHLLCLWAQINERVERGEYCAPFEASLNHRGHTNSLPVWASGRSKPVLADPVPGQDGQPILKPLALSYNRIKTTADARRTKQFGGHLPSAAKSNTAQVLFRNYLRPDQVTREWAEQVMAEALEDAERSVLQAHEDAAMRAHEDASAARGGGPKVIDAPRLPDGSLETGWGACRDHEHHPVTNRPCGDSFIDCFHCSNCLVTRDHLPALLGLLDALVARYQQMDQEVWWARYGPAWAAVRRDILAKFDPAEVEAARSQTATLPDALLDLVEAPWEHS
jgi:hypothetical protein